MTFHPRLLQKIVTGVLIVPAFVAMAAGIPKQLVAIGFAIIVVIAGVLIEILVPTPEWYKHEPEEDGFTRISIGPVKATEKEEQPPAQPAASEPSPQSFVAAATTLQPAHETTQPAQEATSLNERAAGLETRTTTQTAEESSTQPAQEVSAQPVEASPQPAATGQAYTGAKKLTGLNRVAAIIGVWSLIFIPLRYVVFLFAGSGPLFDYLLWGARGLVAVGLLTGLVVLIRWRIGGSARGRLGDIARGYGVCVFAAVCMAGEDLLLTNQRWDTSLHFYSYTKSSITNQEQKKAEQVKEQPKQEAQQTAPQAVSAMTILSDYQRSVTAADKKYKSRTLTISGTVALTGTNSDGLPVVRFEAQYGANSATRIIECTFFSLDAKRVSALKVGEKVNIKGLVKGSSGGSVMVRYCSLQP